MLRRMLKRIAGSAASRPGEPPLPHDKALKDDPAIDATALRRERDALLNLLEHQHQIAFLKGPRVTHLMLKLALHAEGNDIYISECIRKYGIWEPTETDYFLDHMKKGDVFIDIGANIGYFSTIASTLVGNTGKVISLEPDPRNFALLDLNIALNRAKNVTIINAAISDNTEGANLYRSMDNLGDHRLQPVLGAADSVPVRTMPLDAAWFKKPGGNVIVKIDTQGWEGRIILGNLPVLCLADRIVFEWSPPWILETGVDPMAIIEALDSEGYAFRIISEESRTTEEFGVTRAREVLPALIKGSGRADDPIYLDIVAERRHPGN